MRTPCSFPAPIRQICVDLSSCALVYSAVILTSTTSLERVELFAMSMFPSAGPRARKKSSSAVAGSIKDAEAARVRKVLIILSSPSCSSSVI